MKELLELVRINLTAELLQLVLSKPGKRKVAGDLPDRIAMPVGAEPPARVLAAEKCIVRPVMLGERLLFQESAFVGEQVFHVNLKQEEMAQRIAFLMQERFGQLQLMKETEDVTVLVGKKGTVTVKKKRETFPRPVRRKREIFHTTERSATFCRRARLCPFWWIWVCRLPTGKW